MTIYYSLLLLVILVLFYDFYRPILGFELAGSIGSLGKQLSYKDFIMMFAQEEKTEDPTPKKLKDAKKKGQVSKSNELTSLMSFIVGTTVLIIFGKYIYDILFRTFIIVYQDVGQVTLDATRVKEYFQLMVFQFLKIMALVLIPLVFGSIGVNIAQVGFIFSSHPIKLDLKRINPLEGFKRIFSKRVLFEFAKNIAKLTMIVLIVYFFFRSQMPFLMSLMGITPAQAFIVLGELFRDLAFRIGFMLLVLGIADFLYQRYEFRKQLRMTKHEIKEEYKEMEGDPLIKSMRRQKARQIAFNRMIAEVPSATVVVTNPTHFAIAIKYDLEGTTDEVPQVVAKGMNYVAEKIKEIANENDVPIIENKLLARALYKQAEVFDFVPMELYQSVAEILAAVYRMKNKLKRR
jgi:flagellar biosynthetic protein FlhB